MNASPATALTIVAAVVFGTMAFASIATRRFKMDLQQYIVGGRSFGTVLLWILLAGETYTTFAFLGIAGLSYAQGATAFFVLAYGACGYVIAYFFAPAVWRVGKERSLLTGPDFFEASYGSRGLGVAVAVLQFAMIVPYVALQLSGLQILLNMAGYGAYNATLGVCIAFILLSIFVFSTGLRGAAWASIVKDVLVFGAMLFAGIAIPIRFFGTPARMFDRLIRLHPHALTLDMSGGSHSTVWYVSTVLLSAIGFSLGPSAWQAIYSARSGDTIRRNAMLLPLYMAFLPLMMFAGFAASLVHAGLKGAAVDQSFLLLVQQYYPPWALGIIAGAGALAALIPASALLLAGASVVTKNIAGDLFGIVRSDAARTMLTRILVVMVALLALGLWLTARRTIAELLLLYFNGVAQFAPGAFAAFFWPRVTAVAVGAGIAVGLGIGIPLAAMNLTPWGVNPGLLALLANGAVAAFVTLLTRQKAV